MTLNLDKSAWKSVAFGDVVNNVNVTVRDLDVAGIDRVIAMEHMDPGELKVSRWGSTEDGTTFTRRVKPGQTLFGKRRAYQRKVAYAEFDAVCSGDIYTFGADECQLLGEFLPFLVQSNEFFDHALDTSAGSLSPRTNWRDLANFEFDLPPLDEQKRIADLLWAIEHHRTELAEMVELLLGTRRVYLERCIFGAAEAQRISIGELASIKHGYAFSGEFFGTDASYPTLVTPGNFAIGGGFQHAPDKTFSGEYGEDYVLQPGDVIVTMTDLSKAGDTLGYSAVVPAGRKYLHNQRVGKLVFTSVDRVLPEFLTWVLRTASYRDYILRSAAGSTVRHTSPSRIEAFEFPLPDLNRQRLALANIHQIEEARKRALDEIDALATSNGALMTKIFGGR